MALVSYDEVHIRTTTMQTVKDFRSCTNQTLRITKTTELPLKDRSEKRF